MGAQILYAITFNFQSFATLTIDATFLSDSDMNNISELLHKIQFQTQVRSIKGGIGACAHPIF